MGGQSGSPVFKKEDNSMLVGIHKGFSPVKRLNMAVMITSEIVSVI
jgi:V8-like Glu-specific endopeptidase